MKLIHNGKGVIVGCETVRPEDLEGVEVIGCNMTGTEHLPWDEINRQDIKVISLKEYPEFLKEITSTAEHTLGLIVALMRNYKMALNGPYREREAYRGHTLKGKTLGVIGHGRIGRQMERIAVGGLQMQFVYNDYYRCNGRLHEDRTLEALLRESDIVSLHIPLPDNFGFFTKAMFQQMKPTAYLINTSRDGVIEKGALRWALENKVIAGAAIDFIDDPELVEYARTHDNLILTNHIGGCTHGDMERTEAFIVDKVNRWFTGEVV